MLRARYQSTKNVDDLEEAITLCYAKRRIQIMQTMGSVSDNCCFGGSSSSLITTSRKPISSIHYKVFDKPSAIPIKQFNSHP